MVNDMIAEEVMVDEFIAAFSPSTDPALWVRLIDEEFNEVVEASADTTQPTGAAYFGNLLKEAADLAYVMLGWARMAEQYDPEGTSFDEQKFNACLMLLSTVRSTVTRGCFAEAFELVHKSNMSKLLDDGSVLRREDGKVLKGPNYQPPDMLPLGRKVYDILNFPFSGIAA